MTYEEERLFKEKCEKELPILIKVDGIIYKLYAYALMANSYRIMYGDFNTGKYYWLNKPIDLFFDMIDLEEIISKTYDKLQEWHRGTFEIITEEPDWDQLLLTKENNVEYNNILINKTISEFMDIDFESKEAHEKYSAEICRNYGNYHKSYDWIMPVFKELGELGYTYLIGAFAVEWYYKTAINGDANMYEHTPVGLSSACYDMIIHYYNKI